VIAINGKQQADDCNWIGSDFHPSSSLSRRRSSATESHASSSPRIESVF
jgi:hypothetical protein